jgi:nucleotide-binding universal stress UspA family protein
MLVSMNDPRTLMLGVDLLPGGALTEGCRAAADVLLKIVGDTRGRAFLVHSTTRDEYWNPLKRGLVIVTEGISDAGHATIDALADEVRGAGGEGEVVYSEDKPFLAITREAQKRGVELTIVGKHNKREHDSRKLGNVARRILHYSSCPVLVVSPSHAERSGKVFGATDLTTVGGKAVKAAAWAATRYDAELHLAHAYQFSLEDQMHPGGEEGGAYEARHEELRAAAKAEIARELEGTGLEDRAQVHVACGAPDTLLLEAVETLKPDLVVMGTISRGGIAGFLTGNTAERLLDRIPGSILAVKPDDFVSPVQG